jgi:hypothetical protein
VNGSPSKKKQIQVWAKRMSIKPHLVKRGLITLNYDKGTLARITKNKGKTPYLIRKRANRYELVTL